MNLSTQELAEEVLDQFFPGLRHKISPNRINVIQMEEDIQKVLKLPDVISSEVKLWMIDAIVCYHCGRGAVFSWEPESDPSVRTEDGII